MEEKFYLTVGELIRKERRSRNYSQEYMAAKIGISQNGYYKIETGKSKYSVYKLFQILRLLELTPLDIWQIQ